MQTSKTKHNHISYLWDGNRQLQQNTATHTHTIIYEQDSFEPVAQFIWLRDGLTAANDEPETNDEGWYGNNKPVIKTGVQLYHYHNDHLGTPNELTDQQGEVVWYADYRAWGNTATVEWKSQRIDNIVVSEEHLQPIRFQGQHFDTETGLHYNRFRYFDPDMGMFTTRDPIGLMGGTNVFQYAPNPTGWIDPFGLSRCLGLPSSRPGGGTGAAYNKSTGQGLYVLKDSAGDIKYVGRGDASARGAAHQNSVDKAHLRQTILADNNLTKAEAKFLEQKLMDAHGGARSTNPLTNLQNKIRSYAPTNPNAKNYDIAGDSASWGSEILSDVSKKL